MFLEPESSASVILPVYTLRLAVSKIVCAASRKSHGDCSCRVDPGGGDEAARTVSRYLFRLTQSYVRRYLGQSVRRKPECEWHLTA